MIFIVFIFGLLIGSFLNVVILRVPENKDIVFMRSHCVKCKKIIPWYFNIPVLSYIFLKGKCNVCKTGISLQYPFIELITGFLSVFIYQKYFHVDQFQSVILFFIFCLFICQFFIDLKHFILPHSINIIIGLLLLLLVVFEKDWTHWGLGFCFGFFPLYIFSLIYEKLRGQIGLGGGDIVLFGMLGIYLGPEKIFYNITMSCLFGVLVTILFLSFGKISKINKPVPFGPSILIISSIQILYPNFLESKFISLFTLI